MRTDDLPLLIDRQDAAMIGQRVDEDNGVFPGFDDFVEVADRTALHGLREWTVNPDRLVALDEIAADEVAAGEVFMTGDGDQVARNHLLASRYAVVLGPAQGVRHVLDEARFAAPCRTFEKNRQATGV